MQVRVLKKRAGRRLRRVILRRKCDRAWSDFAAEMADALLPKRDPWEAVLRQIARSIIVPIAAQVRADLACKVFGGVTSPDFALHGGTLGLAWPSSRP
ncbi:hypothetical protein EZI45_19035 [Delftia tsuruhatensis]|uniref:hypothetical protein n=1 Tax=Delftia tsuruhatensis TaxID=180282 RepID=UPI0010555FBD|nr:hypothetical protein [Delftia tsuruhatensis]MCX7504532.1 hypothetical protein [Delftia tsuruhatensis]TDF26216.1 hypothetical protein EZI45_19035 [Delftia tsuruhatensis]